MIGSKLSAVLPAPLLNYKNGSRGRVFSLTVTNKTKGFNMGWQDMVGGLVNQVTGNKENEEGENKEGGLGGLLGMAGSLLGDKQAALGQVMGKLGASGVDVNSLLEKLGINPDDASDEDLEKLASHVQENEGAEASSDFAAAETVSDEVAEESSDEQVAEDSADTAEEVTAESSDDTEASEESSDADASAETEEAPAEEEPAEEESAEEESEG